MTKIKVGIIGQDARLTAARRIARELSERVKPIITTDKKKESSKKACRKHDIDQ
jgi:hypothetical protein